VRRNESLSLFELLSLGDEDGQIGEEDVTKLGPDHP